MRDNIFLIPSQYVNNIIVLYINFLCSTVFDAKARNIDLMAWFLCFFRNLWRSNGQTDGQTNGISLLRN